MAGDHCDAGGNEDGLKALCESSVKRVGKSLHKIGNDKYMEMWYNIIVQYWTLRMSAVF